MMKTVSYSLTALAAALLLAGCATPAPDAPSMAVPSGFKEAAQASQDAAQAKTTDPRWKPAEPAEAQARGAWWKVFQDAQLDKLVEEAAAANQNLAAAVARLKQARALAGVAEAERIPQVNVQAGAQRLRASAVSQGLPATADLLPATTYQARLGVSYEVDLFGRVADGVSAARADTRAAEATLQSVTLALQADVAQTYFRLRAADAELALLRQTQKTREESVRIMQRRLELGDAGELDLARARTELAVTQADAQAAERQRAQLEHALAVLLGRPAGAFTADGNPLRAGLALPVIPAGLPSALLERRPDIAAAQQAMIGANARAGAARAAMFPALRLTASGGGESADLADVFKWSSRTWLTGVLFSLPLLDGGRNAALVKRGEAQLEEAVALYRQSVLTAFAEVEDNLVGLRTLGAQAAAIDDAVASARRSAELTDTLYRAGRVGYLDVLDAQRNLAAAERNAVQLRGARAVTTVALIRSLGGGW